MTRILAKSNQQLGLVEHTADVINASVWMFGTDLEPTRLGKAWLRFYKLNPEQAADFFASLFAAAAFHDWGKASSSFEDAILHGHKQLIRHEHLSALMLAVDTVQPWLQSQPAVYRNREIILSAVATHHLKLRDYENFAPLVGEQSIFTLLRDRPDFARLLKLIEQRLGLTAQRPMFALFWSFATKPGTFPLEALREKVGKRFKNFGRELERKPELRRLNTAVRAALIAADAAASGLFRLGVDLHSFIDNAFTNAPLCDYSYVTKEIIGKRVEQLRSAGKWIKWNDFQNQAEDLQDRALLLEPCGSGKTLAAWRWIASRLKDGRKVARVIFLYPTRATATEGFRDYVSWAPEDDAALMHGTAEYDLDGMFENPKDPDDHRNTKQFETEQRLFAVGFWTKLAFSATVDQFLAFMQQSYGPVCMLPVLADSVVVIDEVHSFDHAMFSALKCFLNEFDVPVLCMSATVPEERRTQLTGSCGLKLPAAKRPADLQAIADAKRYRLRRVNEDQVSQRVLDAIHSGKRVLWVVNQVKRAQQIALRMRGVVPPPASVFCYHSRFMLLDRRERHKEVVNAFQGEGKAMLALTTQVCEMSLDLDADLLALEDCPITSCIQRMGRCHRNRILRKDAGEILVYKPENHSPYDLEHLRGLQEFLGKLCTANDENDVSQTMLEDALKEYGPKLGLPDRWCAFVNSGPYAQGGDETFRDIEEFTVPAVLQCKIPDFLAAQKQRQPTAGLILPIPRRWKLQLDPRPPLPKYLAVAPDDHYDAKTGFWDIPVPQGGPLP
jgi:CRISPR-associated endonuclease/helicase Cas3